MIFLGFAAGEVRLLSFAQRETLRRAQRSSSRLTLLSGGELWIPCGLCS